MGQGYHQFVWSTFVSKRFRWFEPYFGAWYNLPVRTNGSPFQKYGPTQTSVNPQQRGGVMIGVEQIAWENPRGDQRVTIEARAFVEEHFFGRERSEIWEPLSGASTCTTNTPTDLPSRASISSTSSPKTTRRSAPRTPASPTSTTTPPWAVTSASTSRSASTSGFAACSGSGATFPTSSPPTAPASTPTRRTAASTR